jgi:hypothetical protein
MVADVGVTAIPTTETSHTVALATLAGSIRLLARIVTAWGAVIVAGAV